MKKYLPEGEHGSKIRLDAIEFPDATLRVGRVRPRPPSTIKFLGREITVSFRPESEMPNHDGEWVENKMAITIREGLRALEEADTTLHELCHGVSDLMMLNLSERQVRCLATALIGIFQDNPELASYLTRRMNNEATT